MELESRKNFKTSEEFKDAFLETLTPGVIPRSDFIHWDIIQSKVEANKQNLIFFKNLSAYPTQALESKMRDSLLASDAPFYPIKTAFELIAHTKDKFVTCSDYINLPLFSEKEKTEEDINFITKLLIDLGIEKVLRTNIDDYFLGVQVGLETHRRKNVGGNAFKVIIADVLKQILNSLNTKGYNFILTEEEKIFFSDGKTSKTVDFCLKNETYKFGLEINFYTSSGSKPTEIKRSYGHVNRELEKVNAVLIWVTDGVGYMDMKKSLKEARDIHKNIYNLNMFKQSFEKDVLTLIENNS